MVESIIAYFKAVKCTEQAKTYAICKVLKNLGYARYGKFQHLNWKEAIHREVIQEQFSILYKKNIEWLLGVFTNHIMEWEFEHRRYSELTDKGKYKDLVSKKYDIPIELDTEQFITVYLLRKEVT